MVDRRYFVALKNCRKNYDLDIPDKNLWVFGYGSLMWDPGFEFSESNPARLHGYHRNLCLWSVKFRGTKKNPGLVLGLTPGGSCKGVAFRLGDNNRGSKLDDIFNREMVTNAYRPVIKSVYFNDGGSVRALAFVSKTDHPQYAGKMNQTTAIQIIKNAKGPRGSNSEYIINTVSHLASMGIRDENLHAIAGGLNAD